MFVGRLAHLRRREHNVGKLAEPLSLLFDQELGIADQIDEQDVPDLKTKVLLGFRRHGSLDSRASLVRPDLLFSGKELLKAGIIAAEPGEPAKAGNPRQHMAVGSVEAIDKPFQEITLKGPDGSQETVMVENPETLEHLKVGDQIVITDALALALSLEK